MSISSGSVPFSLPFVSSNTLDSVSKALNSGEPLHGDARWTKQVEEQLRRIYGLPCYLVNSCSSALEMAIMLSGVGPGDEVILPDFTFTSTANAIALRGATPVFADVSDEDLNINVESVKSAITGKTKAVMAVHYGGVPANLEKLRELSNEAGLYLIEDAAQGVGVEVNGRPLGTHGDFGCLSFHATKNIQSGEGGALICSTEDFAGAAEVIREKGTDRAAFYRGEVDKYTWRSLGSSLLPSDLTAAYLLPQLSEIGAVTQRRLDLWSFYRENLVEWASRRGVRIVASETGLRGNGHIFGLIFPSSSERSLFSTHMKEKGVSVSSHYVPLHSTPAGARYGRVIGNLKTSNWAGNGLVRLPMHDLAEKYRERIVQTVLEFS